MSLELFFNHFDLISTAPNGVGRLREMILNLAVRGQLVEQRETEEEAQKLLEKIRAEKKRISGEKGKAKLFAEVSSIDENDAPFAIPENWVWTNLGEISTNVHYGYTASADKFKKGVRLLRITDIQNGKVDWESVPGCEIKEKEIENYELQDGDLLIARTGGTIGKSFLVKNVSVRAVFASYLIRVVPSAEMLPEFVKSFLESQIYWTQLYAKSMGTGQPNVNGTSLRSLVLPLPPLEEQKRIVEKVEELMRMCDHLETQMGRREELQKTLNRSALGHLQMARTAEDFQNRFNAIIENFTMLYDAPVQIAPLCQIVLRLAVQGKLVAQDPADEAADVLLDKIKVEKRRLANGKAKLFDDAERIAENDTPFEIPKGWAWAKFPQLGELNRGKSKHRPRNAPELFEDGKYKLVQTGDVARANRFVKTYTSLYGDKGLAQSKMWKAGTLCITIAANIADTGILSFDACFPDSVVGFVPSKIFGDANYLEFFMRTAKNHLQDFAPSTAQKNINLGILNELLIPIPPFAEQKRIVAKVEQLLSICDKLQNSLTEKKIKSNNLLISIVSHI